MEYGIPEPVSRFFQYMVIGYAMPVQCMGVVLIPEQGEPWMGVHAGV
jgi:hypothetical protein